MGELTKVREIRKKIRELEDEITRLYREMDGELELLDRKRPCKGSGKRLGSQALARAIREGRVGA